MRTVVFLNNGNLGSFVCQRSFQAVIFTIENDRVLGVESEYIADKDINYLTLWCLNKGINDIYIKEIDTSDKMKFIKLNINIRTLDELGNDHLYNTFIIKE